MNGLYRAFFEATDDITPHAGTTVPLAVTTRTTPASTAQIGKAIEAAAQRRAMMARAQARIALAEENDEMMEARP